MNALQCFTQYHQQLQEILKKDTLPSPWTRYTRYYQQVDKETATAQHEIKRIIPLVQQTITISATLVCKDPDVIYPLCREKILIQFEKCRTYLQFWNHAIHALEHIQEITHQQHRMEHCAQPPNLSLPSCAAYQTLNTITISIITTCQEMRKKIQQEWVSATTWIAHCPCPSDNVINTTNHGGELLIISIPEILDRKKYQQICDAARKCLDKQPIVLDDD